MSEIAVPLMSEIAELKDLKCIKIFISMWGLFVKAVPQWLSNISWVLMLLINMTCTKSFESSKETAAVGFANALVYGFCFSLFIGLNTGYNIFGCQAIAKSKHQLYIQTIQHLLLQTLFSVIFIIIFNNVTLLTQAVGIEPSVQVMISDYIQRVLPAALMFCLTDLIRQFLSVNQVYNYLTIVFPLLAVSIHFILAPYLADSYGLIGIAYSLDIVCTFNLLCMLIFVKKQQLIKLEYVSLNVIFDKSYYCNVLTIAMTLYLDFICFDLLAVIAGQLGSVLLATHTIITTFYSIMTSFSFALQTILSNQISLNFSNGHLSKIITIIVSGVLLNAFFIGIMISILNFLHNPLFSLFTVNPKVIQSLESMVNIITIQINFDFTAIILQSITNALGFQKQTLVIYFSGYYLWVLPLSFYLAEKYKLYGIWLGFSSGTFLMMFALLYLIIKCDFKKQYEIYQQKQSVDNQDIISQSIRKLSLYDMIEMQQVN